MPGSRNASKGLRAPVSVIGERVFRQPVKRARLDVARKLPIPARGIEVLKPRAETLKLLA